MRKRNYAACQFCGKKLEYTQCSERGVPPDDARCQALKGWLSVSQWKGMGVVDHYDFCSFTCLQAWVGAQVPKIPKTFFEAFQDESA